MFESAIGAAKCTVIKTYMRAACIDDTITVSDVSAAKHVLLLLVRWWCLHLAAPFILFREVQRGTDYLRGQKIIAVAITNAAPRRARPSAIVCASCSMLVCLR